MLLRKQISQIGNISQLWKIRDQEKLVDALSKIINMMRDLYQLAGKQNIKSRLHSGDGLERVYKWWMTVEWQDGYQQSVK